MEQEHISLNKYISETGLCSRRDADKLIEAGRVKINETIARKGNRVTSSDKVYLDNELIIKKLEKESPLYDYTEEIKAAADRAAAPFPRAAP